MLNSQSNNSDTQPTPSVLRELEITLANLERETRIISEEIVQLSLENKSLESHHSLYKKSCSNFGNLDIDDAPTSESQRFLLSPNELDNDFETRVFLSKSAVNVEPISPVTPSRMFQPKPIKKQTNLAEILRSSTKISDKLADDIERLYSVKSSYRSQSPQEPKSSEIVSDLVDNIFFLTINEEEVKRFKEEGAVKYSYVPAFEEQKDKFESSMTKHFIPLKNNLSTKIFKNSIKSIKEIIFGNNSTPIEMSWVGFSDPHFRQTSNKILKVINQRRLKYFFIIKLDDFYVSFEDSIPERGLIHLDFFQKFLVLETAFPLSKFFSEMLTSIVTDLRNERWNFFSKLIENGDLSINQISELSAKRFTQLDLKILQDYMHITKCIFPDFASFVQLPNSVKPIKLLSKKTAYISESQVYFADFFSNLPFNDFILIFLSLLQEKPVVFISENPKQLSAAVSAFQALIQPFRWPHIVIYSISKDEIEILSTKITGIVGLCMNSSICRSEVMSLNPNGRIWVYLDLALIHCHESLSSNIVVPTFENFLSKSQSIYSSSFNSKTSVTVNIVKKQIGLSQAQGFHTLSGSEFSCYAERATKVGYNRPTIYDSKDYSQMSFEAQIQIFLYMRFFFNTFFVMKLPKQVEDSNDRLTSFDLNQFSGEASDAEFLKRFFDTQIFAEFMKNDFQEISEFGTTR